MVIQRNLQSPIWGTATANEKVTIEIAGKTVTATADPSGNWMTRLPSLQKGDATSMTITGSDGSSIVLKDVLVGDVWICSGQSNMGFLTRQAKNAAQEIADANHPNIRLFSFERTVSLEPSKEVKGQWKVCSPDTVGDFTAVGYFFGRDINKMEDVPVGLIENAWGGMPAEAFTSKEALQADPDLKPLVELKEKAKEGAEQRKEKYDKELKAWQEKHYLKDPGNKGEEKGWAKSDFDDSDWKSMDEPSKWESHGMKIEGAVWFRKTVEIPKDWDGKDLLVSLGILDDFDTTYFNGEKIGSIGSDNIYAWAAQRNYEVPARLVKSGKAVIATRIFDQWGEGGFSDPPDALAIGVKGDAKNRIPLAGPWKYKVEYSVDTPSRIPGQPVRPLAPTNPNMASNLFNGMVYPVIPYGIKGAIWYQGESNAPRAVQYRKLFPTMIEDWRKHWGEGDFPFLFVQLANYGNGHPKPTEPADSQWAELREAQTMTLSKSPNTGMAVTVDVGESNNIHPTNKQDVGKRLALAAEHVAYGKNDLEYSGPMYDSMKVEGNKIRVKFSHADGLTAKGGDPKTFQIAGEDKKFVWADAKIEGDSIVVSAKGVEHPVAVRYGWSDDPEANVYNLAGLPASPFRTDDWPASTEGVLSRRARR